LASKFDEIMATTTSSRRLLLLREEMRRPVSGRKISVDQAIIAVREMPGDASEWVYGALGDSPPDLVKAILSVYVDDLDPFKLDANADYFEMARSVAHGKDTEFDAIHKGSMNLLVEQDDFHASKLLEILSGSKEWPWKVTNINHAYFAIACIRWFASANEHACLGKVETAVGSIALQVLARTVDGIPCTFDLGTQGKLLRSNKVTVVGALVGYYDSVIWKSDEGTSRRAAYAKNLEIAVKKYAEMYAYSDTILDGWLDHDGYSAGLSCDACGEDDGVPHPKWYTIEDMQGHRKAKMTLCSQCATKVFIVWCGDLKTYGRRIRAVRYFYAFKNYAPETYCDDPSNAKTGKKFGVRENESIAAIATSHLAEIGHVERFSVKFGGSLAR
jgi:hypothetical protein